MYKPLLLAVNIAQVAPLALILQTVLHIRNRLIPVILDWQFGAMFSWENVADRQPQRENLQDRMRPSFGCVIGTVPAPLEKPALVH